VLVHVAKSRKEAFIEDLAMLRLACWLATVAALTLLVWQITVEQPAWLRLLCGVLLLLVSILTGMRIGTDFASGYIKDLQRVNKVLADQNQELQEANAMLLKQLAAESPAASENT
jgi:hypothetical protein